MVLSPKLLSIRRTIRLLSIAILLLVWLLWRDIVVVDSFSVSLLSEANNRRTSASAALWMSTIEDLETPLDLYNTKGEDKPLLVCTTASSAEGVGFCRQVLKRGKFRVRALVPNSESSNHRILEEMGAELFVADNDDVESLRRAFQGAHGVYGLTTWSRDDISLGAEELENIETRQGINIIDAAMGTGRAYDHPCKQYPLVKHFVLQSMHRGGRRRKSDYPDPRVEAPFHHKAKWRQEDALLTRMTKKTNGDDTSPLWSILRQPTYLESVDHAASNHKLKSLSPGIVRGLLGDDISLTVIAREDFSALACRMFEDEQALKYGNGGVLVAGSERVTGKHMARMANQVCEDKRLKFVYRPIPWSVWNLSYLANYLEELKQWLAYGGNDEGISLPNSCYNHAISSSCKSRADKEDFLHECRQVYPGMLSVEDWLISRGVDKMARHPSVTERFVELIRASNAISCAPRNGVITVASTDEDLVSTKKMFQ